MTTAYRQPVLVISGHRRRAERIERILGERGHPVQVAGTGERGVELACESRPHVILLDHDLPDMSPVDACIALQCRPHPADAPVILLAGPDDDVDRAHALAVGVTDCLRTPIDAVELTARVALAARVRRLTDELRNPTMRDGLTGLLNRSFFLEQFQRECNRARRYDSLLALVAVAVDDLPHLAGRYGDGAGEDVLRTLAGVLTEQTRESDCVARWDRERMVLLLPEGDLPKAIGLAKKLHSAIRDCDFRSGGEPVEPTVSLGVASRQNIGGRDPSDLLELVHACVDEARRLGGDRIAYHTCGEFCLVRQG